MPASLCHSWWVLCHLCATTGVLRHLLCAAAGDINPSLQHFSISNILPLPNSTVSYSSSTPMLPDFLSHTSLSSISTPVAWCYSDSCLRLVCTGLMLALLLTVVGRRLLRDWILFVTLWFNESVILFEIDLRMTRDCPWGWIRLTWDWDYIDQKLTSLRGD